MTNIPAAKPERTIGRYVLYGEIAAGGMASVHLGRLMGPVGFTRTVAIKRLHSQFAKDPEFVSMFLDEARLAARIQHPNVISTLDVVSTEGELFIVMEYIHGDSLARLLRAGLCGAPPDLKVIGTILCGALHGLHCAHEARGENGQPLRIVHRDISPQNILVGTDGIPRVLDFGVAKAVTRVHSTQGGQIKGKLRYMAPEQIRNLGLDRRVDVYAAGAVLWESLTGRRYIESDEPSAIILEALQKKADPPSKYNSSLSPAVDAIVLKALAPDASERFATARDFAVALEHEAGFASPAVVGDWVRHVAQTILEERSLRIAEVESATNLTSADWPASLSGVRNPSTDQDETVVVRDGGPLAHQESQVTSATAVTSATSVAIPVSKSAGRRAAFLLGAAAVLAGVAAGAIALSASHSAQPPALAPLTGAIRAVAGAEASTGAPSLAASTAPVGEVPKSSLPAGSAPAASESAVSKGVAPPGKSQVLVRPRPPAPPVPPVNTSPSPLNIAESR